MNEDVSDDGLSQAYKHYTVQARTAIRGESFFEMLISAYAIPHHITGPKDLGVDYLCEWTFGDKPSGVLFSVQVKAFNSEHITIESTGRNKSLNNLESYRIANSNLRIDSSTLSYWRGMGHPAYLFAIAAASDLSKIDCYYKRYTPHITNGKAEAQSAYSEDFYHCNLGMSFLAFADMSKKTQGFARDLFIDHVRCAYSKGIISFPDPRSMGLNQFSADTFFSADLYGEYKDKLHATYDRYRKHLGSRRP